MLVVNNFNQKKGVDFEEIFSSVIKMSSIRVVLRIAAIFDLEIEKLDVKTAFSAWELGRRNLRGAARGIHRKGKKRS